MNRIRCSDVEMSSDIQMFRCSDIQIFECSYIQIFGCSDHRETMTRHLFYFHCSHGLGGTIETLTLIILRLQNRGRLWFGVLVPALGLARARYFAQEVGPSSAFTDLRMISWTRTALYESPVFHCSGISSRMSLFS